jgi:transposase-like protein
MNENPAPPSAPAKPPREYLTPTPEEKAQWVKRFQESGLSIRKFSAQHDLPRMSLWRWVREVPAPEGASLAGGVTSPFTELKLPAGLAGSNWAVELTLPNGTVLRMSRDVPAEMVERLLRLC